MTGRADCLQERRRPQSNQLCIQSQSEVLRALLKVICDNQYMLSGGCEPNCSQVTWHCFQLNCSISPLLVALYETQDLGRADVA